MLSTGLKSYLNGKYSRYGEVRQLNLDTKAHRIEAELLLKGEEQPVTVQAEYAISTDEAGNALLKLSNAQASRVWMQAVLDDRFADGMSFPLPPQAAGFLGMLG